MGRVALTLWFTISALLGPGVCCCSFASAKATTADDQSATSSAKSCCQRDAPPRRPHGNQKPEPCKPTKCPCEKGKQVETLPPVTTANADLAAHLESAGTPPAGLLFSSTFDLAAATPPSSDAHTSAARPAGRDLLAAYSVLRC